MSKLVPDIERGALVQYSQIVRPPEEGPGEEFIAPNVQGERALTAGIGVLEAAELAEWLTRSVIPTLKRQEDRMRRMGWSGMHEAEARAYTNEGSPELVYSLHGVKYAEEAQLIVDWEGDTIFEVPVEPVESVEAAGRERKQNLRRSGLTEFDKLVGITDDDLDAAFDKAQEEGGFQ